jgi:hypothetical protein
MDLQGCHDSLDDLLLDICAEHFQKEIGQKQLQIFRQKTVGSDILLYRPAPLYE